MTATGSDGERSLLPSTFAALRVPNYRRYITAHAASLVGTSGHQVGQGWLVLELTDSATALGAVVALYALPTVPLGQYAGLIADRFNKRRLMMTAQSAMASLAALLGILVLINTVRAWHVFVLAMLMGIVYAFELPARQGFTTELVGTPMLRNALGVSSALMSAGRLVGPAVAGIIIGLGGLAWCFLIAAATYLFLVIQLARLTSAALYRYPPAPRLPGQLREAVRHAIDSRVAGTILVMIALLSCLACQFPVVLPVLAKELNGDPTTYGLMASALGLGSIIGGVWTANRGTIGLRPVVIGIAAFAGCVALAALAPTAPAHMVALVGVGATTIHVFTCGNTTVQLSAEPSMRGRLIGLWALAFIGTTPLGGVVVGLVTNAWGGRAGLWLAAAGALVAVLIGLTALEIARRNHSTQATARPHNEGL